MKTIIGVNGACGRMGKRIIQIAEEDRNLELGAALDAAGHPEHGRDAGEISFVGRLGVTVSSTLPLEPRLDAMIDFSMPEGTMSVLRLCLERKIPLVVATTGFSAEQKREIDAAAHHIALLCSPNLSLVVNVLFKLVREAALALRERDFDIEIIERHHRYKKDSPSGTALQFARIIQEALGDMPVRHGREGLVGERPPREIGMHAVRAGDNVGEHAIVFSTLGETMELVHKGHSRDAYVRGALMAAKYLAGRPAGRYSMSDVLGLS
jgi:4-hydroxy-tetrahydrodipicolinate reductase